MKRPQIKDYFDKALTLGQAAKKYAQSPELFNYAKALDKHIDFLESPRIVPMYGCVQVDYKPLVDNIEELAEYEYTMELQNLNDRLGPNEAFLEGIKVGIKAGLEKSKV